LDSYPQALFPNWTDAQIKRSRIQQTISEYDKTKPSTIHYVDVDSTGFFTDSGKLEASEETKSDFWDALINEQRADDIRVRALFIENMTGPVLQMLGAR
jgi:hypothetical protein